MKKRGRKPVPAYVRKGIRGRQNNEDPYSGQELGRGFAAHLDHTVSLADGGRDDQSNMKYLNIDTHDRKHAVEDGFSPAQAYGWSLEFQRSFFYDMFKDEDEEDQPK